MQRSTPTTWVVSALAALALALASTVPAADNKKEKEQKEIRNIAQDTLQRLYKADATVKAAVESAAGYAVFGNLGVKILLAGSGDGKGIAVNNESKTEDLYENARGPSWTRNGRKEIHSFLRL